jgi:glyoxylase-like metal-dependent hydrolase (beta-lactamase superfamily II)
MDINIVEKDIIQFQFDPEENHYYGYNIYAILDNDKALLIDAAFERHCREVDSYLQNQGVTIDTVILSHFHHDHMDGIRILKDIRKIGSDYFYMTLSKYPELKDADLFTPDVFIDHDNTMTYGAHKLRLSKTDGHTPCTIFTEIDETYLHVSDEIILSNKGEPLLPFVGLNSNRKGVISLERIEQSGLSIMPGHGSVLKDKARIQNDIHNRIAYLDNVFNSSGDISYEDAVGNSCEFFHKEWHRYNCMRY